MTSVASVEGLFLSPEASFDFIVLYCAVLNYQFGTVKREFKCMGNSLTDVLNDAEWKEKRE